jgi:hypothetical protein
MASPALITTEPEHIKDRGVLNVNKLKYAIMTWILFATALCTGEAFSQTARWSEQKANEWYARQPWLVGSNYIPRPQSTNWRCGRRPPSIPLKLTKN